MVSMLIAGSFAGSRRSLSRNSPLGSTTQKKFATYTQEQVDKIFLAAATAADKARITLAKLAVEETGMGIVEDKVIKNHYAAEYIYNAYKETKTCGVIEEDKAFGIKKVAEPIGVIAAVIPTTNPTSTAIFKCLLALKTRNAIIISPHPRAKNSTIAAAKLILEAAVAAGAPEGIIDWIDVPSLEMTNTVMKEADIILATGGPGMVKAAYSSGKPALGVGAGNTPALIDESADILLAVSSIIHSKTFDNGMICASEQSVIVLDSIYDTVKSEFAQRGCYFLNEKELDKARKTIIINGALNAKIVGQKAVRIAELSGVTVPAGTKILIGEVDSVDVSEEFAHEKLSPVLAMYRAHSFEEALDKADTKSFADYVLMFMPRDMAFRVALEADPMLWQEAYQKNVLISTEQTIMPFLKIMQLTWNKFHQDTNTQKITQAAQNMIDRVADFYDQYIELGKKLKAVGTAYNGGVTKLQDGGRSITTSAKQVISLGTKLSKGKELNIPEEIPEIGSAE